MNTNNTINRTDKNAAINALTLQLAKGQINAAEFAAAMLNLNPSQVASKEIELPENMEKVENTGNGKFSWAKIKGSDIVFSFDSNKKIHSVWIQQGATVTIENLAELLK